MDYTEWTFNEKTPIYIQLTHKLRYSILSSRLLPGENIPSIRSMAAILRLNINTVARSYRLINQDGLIFTQGKRNYCVTSDSVLIQKKRIQKIKRFCHNYISVMTELGLKKQIFYLLYRNIVAVKIKISLLIYKEKAALRLLFG
ncbi:MAG: GntR family transcriptional regulator [Lachnospiraceae bacterium]|nr:GntR family transcriptional regulator [Lachnospiraceae bacterium]